MKNKMKNKIFPLLLTVVLTIGIITPVGALALLRGPKPSVPGVIAPTGQVAESTFTETEPTQTTVKIHKLQADSYKDEAPWVHSGGVINDSATLGTNVKPLAGVKFTIYKVANSADYDVIAGAKPATGKAMETYIATGKATLATGAGLTDGITAPTKADGTATVTLDKGFYWVIESEKPTEASSSIAVPFGILLPFTNPFAVGSHKAGSGFLTEVNVYPKNITAPLPTVKKYVDEVGNMDSSHNMMDTFKYIIETELPTNIKDYKKFYISDIKPDYLHLMPTPKVYYTDKVKLEEIEKETPLTGNDVQYKEKNFNGKPSIELIISGVKNLQDPTKKLYIVYEARIQTQAIMGKDIKNGAELTINNGTKDVILPLAEENFPTVHTGGKMFKKVSNQGDLLRGVKFIIQDAKNPGAIKYLKGSNTDDGGYQWTTEKTEAKEFTSGADGTFSVIGLEDSVKGHMYQLVETETIAGYAKIGPVDFEISKTSYYGDPTTIDSSQTAADVIQEIVNNKIIIPQAGGIGTIIFIIAGIVIMGGAFLAMRKNRLEK